MTCNAEEGCGREAAPGRGGKCSSCAYRAWSKKRGSRWARMTELERTAYRAWHAARRAAECGAEVLEFTPRDHSRLYRRQRKRCHYCREKSAQTLQMDHVIPLVLGGRHAVGNIVLACPTCNKLKAGMTVMQWKLAKRVGKYPKAPDYDPNWGEE